MYSIFTSIRTIGLHPLRVHNIQTTLFRTSHPIKEINISSCTQLLIRVIQIRLYGEFVRN